MSQASVNRRNSIRDTFVLKKTQNNTLLFFFFWIGDMAEICVLEDNIDYFGNDIRNVREVSIDECKRECIEQLDCAGKSVVHQLAKENMRLIFYVHPYKLNRK